MNKEEGREKMSENEDTEDAYDVENVFAKILRGELRCDKVCENEGALAFRDVSPRAPVHVLVIPKASVKTWDAWLELGLEEREYFLTLVREVIEVEGLKEGGYRVVMNAGRDGCQEVPHFHMHILGGRVLGKILP
jgi:histidine triad (HIT) family protein